MLIIRDQTTFRAMVALAMEHGRFEPGPGSTSSDGYLGPLLAYLEDLGGTDEFKFHARLVLSSSTEPLSLTFTQESRHPGGVWVKQLEGTLFFESTPRPRFQLRFAPMVTALSAI